MRIFDLIWDDWNEDHIAHHGVSLEEVEEVIYGATHIIKGRGGTYRVIGQTLGGRFLTVVVAPRGGGTYYVVTARDANSEERRAYRRH